MPPPSGDIYLDTELLFNCRFMQGRVILEIQKLKNIRIVNKLLRLNFRKLYFRFNLNRFFILACKKSLVIQNRNLSVQLMCRPSLIGYFIHIPVTGSFIFYTKKHSIMTPTQFVTQCVTILKSLIEQSHILEITFIKAFSKLCICSGSAQNTADFFVEF